MGMVAMEVTYSGMCWVFRMEARVDEMRLEKAVVKKLVQFVEEPHWAAGVERMSEAKRCVSLWSVLTLMVRRVVCLS